MSAGETNKSKSTSDDLAELDTGRGSILHYLFTCSPRDKTTFLQSYLVPYVIAVALCYGLPLIVMRLATPNIILRSESLPKLRCGFLQDLNLLFSHCVTLPVLLIFILSERTMIPKRLARLVQTGAIPITQLGGDMANLWRQRYKTANIIGQLVSLMVAVIMCIPSYKFVSANKYTTWQCGEGDLGVAAWLYLGWQLPCFFWIVSFYVIRGLTATIFLFSICQNSEIKVTLFHHDNCCGLKPVGHFGLRNQYLLALTGVNLLLLWRQVSMPQIENIYGVSLVIIGAIVYVTFGPIVFLGPLLPFRRIMLSAKEKEQEAVADRLRTEYARIMKELEKHSMSKEDGELVDRLQKLKSLVDRIPVWPFDMGTLRKFFAAYILPFLTALLSLLISHFIKS